MRVRTHVKSLWKLDGVRCGVHTGPFAGLWNLASAATKKAATKKGLLQTRWRRSHGTRIEWKRELPTSTKAARNLNDKADKAAKAALATVKHEVEAGVD